MMPWYLQAILISLAIVSIVAPPVLLWRLWRYEKMRSEWVMVSLIAMSPGIGIMLGFSLAWFG